MIRLLLDIYSLVLVAYVILSYLPQFRGEQWYVIIYRLGDFTCKPIRNLLPSDLPLDPSPIIVFFGINLLKALW